MFRPSRTLLHPYHHHHYHHGSHIHLHIESPPTWHFKNSQPFRDPGEKSNPETLHRTCLVGGLEHVFHILGIVIPTDFHIFQRGRSTTNQMLQPIIFPGNSHRDLTLTLPQASTWAKTSWPCNACAKPLRWPKWSSVARHRWGHRRAPKGTEPRLDLVGSALSPW